MKLFSNVVVSVCCFSLCVYASVLFLRGEYIESFSLGVLNVSIMQLYKLVVEWIKMNKAFIILSFFIIFSTTTVYEISQSFFYPAVLNFMYLLIWVIATYHFNLFKIDANEEK